MSNTVFPEYIQRIDAQNQIMENIEKVKHSEVSRAFLLYGEGLKSVQSLLTVQIKSTPLSLRTR